MLNIIILTTSIIAIKKNETNSLKPKSISFGYKYEIDLKSIQHFNS